RELLLREVRLDDLRPPDAVPRSRQLPVRHALPGGGEEPEPRRRPDRDGHAHPPAPDLRRGQASRGHPRAAALSGKAAILRPSAVGRLHRGLGRRAEELRAESRLRLRRPTPGRAAPQVRSAVEGSARGATAEARWQRPVPRSADDYLAATLTLTSGERGTVLSPSCYLGRPGVRPA